MLYWMNHAWQKDVSQFRILALLSSGQALFETLFYERGVLYFWEEHWQRLQNSLKVLGAQIDSPKLKTLILDRLKNEPKFQRARIKLICLLPLEQSTLTISIEHFVILIEPLSQASQKPIPLKLKTFPSPFRPEAPLLQHKTINYGYHFYYRSLAKGQGFDDALYLSADGYLQETSISNIFAVKDGQLFTPPVSQGILPGTVRSLLIQHLGAKEMSIHIEHLQQFDFFFVTSSVRQLRFVTQIDEHSFSNNHLSTFKQILAKWEQLKQNYRQQFLKME